MSCTAVSALTSDFTHCSIAGSPYYMALADAIPEASFPYNQLRVAASIIEGYLTLPTELLLRATFCDFISSSTRREEIHRVAGAWATSQSAMNFSRVNVTVHVGRLPLRGSVYAEGSPYADPTFFRGVRSKQTDVTMPLDLAVFPSLVQRVFENYFPHCATLINPTGTCTPARSPKASVQVPSLKKAAVEGANTPTVYYPTVPFQELVPTPENPTYDVTLKLQVLDEEEDLDRTVEPLLKIVKHTGSNPADAEVIENSIITEWPEVFAPVPNPKRKLAAWSPRFNL